MANIVLLNDEDFDSLFACLGGPGVEAVDALPDGYHVASEICYFAPPLRLYMCSGHDESFGRFAKSGEDWVFVVERVIN